MAQKRWTLRILDAKAAHRAWSKRRVMVAIAAAVIDASVVAPVAVRADEAATAPTTPAIEQVVDAKDVAQGTSIKISMTNKRSYRIPFAVENVDVETLQQMIDEGKVALSQYSSLGATGLNAVKTTTLQGNLDQLIPGLAAVLLTLLCCKLLKKKVSPIVIILALFAVGIVGHLIGLL